jgi:hypothetical protein
MERPGRPGAVAVAVLCAVVLVTATPAGAAGAYGPAPAEHGGVAGAVVGQPVAADTVVITVSLAPDGTATWAVEYLVRLENENETAAFGSLTDDVRQNTSSYVDPFARGIRGTVSDAGNTTDREMAASNFSVQAETRYIGQRYGVVTYSFTWRHFAAVEDGQVRAGGALSGLFLTPDTTLRFEWPEDYELASASPEPTDSRERAVSWAGQIDFASGEPRVVVAPAGGLPLSPAWPAVAVAALAVVVAAGYLVRRRRSGADEPDDEEGTAARPAGESDASTGGSGEDDDRPPAELLSNEERVRRLLRDHGGRVKQQEVVADLDWTEAKTSQVISGMREEDEIEVFRLGRENVVRLPEEDNSDESS